MAVAEGFLAVVELEGPGFLADGCSSEQRRSHKERAGGKSPPRVVSAGTWSPPGALGRVPL